jgi:hypothetical protein
MRQLDEVFEHVCYHGTAVTTPFERFNLSLTGAEGPGIYLADRFESAVQYGGGVAVIRAKVTLQNPFYFYPSDDSLDAMANPELLEQVLGDGTLKRVLDRMEREGLEGYGFEVMHALQDRGHDGIVMVYPFGDPVAPGCSAAAVVIAFDADQVEILHRAPANDPVWRADPSLVVQPKEKKRDFGDAPSP